VASGKAERSLKKAEIPSVFQTFSSETRVISSLPHYFLTRWNADVQRAQAHLSEEVRKSVCHKIMQNIPEICRNGGFGVALHL
jgi:hypothetical protein